MSAENMIKSYLIDGQVNMLDNTTLDLLESTLLTEDYTIEPMKIISRALSSINDIVGLKMLSAKKDMVVGGIRKTVSNINRAIFDDTETGQQNPTTQAPPKTKKEIDGYLRKIYKWLATKIEIDFATLKYLFNKSYAFIVKALVGVGLVAPIAVTMWAGAAGAISVPSALAISGVAIFLALMVVYLCIINAIEISGDDDKLNFDGALTNIINGFKKLFTSLKLRKGETKFAMVSAMLTGLLALFYTVVPVQRLMENVVKFTKFAAKGLWNAAKTGPVIRNWARAYAKNRGVITKEKEAELLAKGILGGEEATQAISQAGSELKSGYEKTKGFMNTNAPTIGKKMNDVESTMLVSTEEWAKRLTKFIKVVVVPLIIFMTIIYLFAELVDQFNLEKIRKGEESESEEEFI